VSVHLIEPGPPSPPDSVTVEEVTDSTAQLAWSPGSDNGSPITNYLIQTRTPFTVGWQRVNTGMQHFQKIFKEFKDLLREILVFLHPVWLGGQSVSYRVKALEMVGIQSLTPEIQEVVIADFILFHFNHFNELLYAHVD